MVALWGGLGAPTHSPGTTDRRCSLPSPFHSPKIRAERAPAIPAADDVSAWLPASLACFRRYLDDFDFQLVPPLSSALSPILLLLPPRTVSAPPSPAARKRRRTMDDFARFVKRHAVRREKSRRERERERYLLGRRRRRRRSGEEAEKKSAEKAMVGETRRGFVARTVCRSGWTTRRGPFVSSARSIVYPGVDRWPIYTCTVAPPRAREDRHKWSSTRHSEAFHAAGVLATRYASTPTPSTPSRISSGRNNLSSARWRQGVVRRDVTRPVYMNGRRAERFPAFFDL